MNDSKPWYRSQTILAVIATLIVQGVGMLLKVDATDLKPEIVDGLVGLGTLVGAALAIQGRVKARATITPPDAGKAGLLLIFAAIAALVLSGCTPWASSVGVTSATPYGTVSVSWKVGGNLASPDKQITTPDKVIALPVK
jgi:Ca2+/H+ antiporter